MTIRTNCDIVYDKRYIKLVSFSMLKLQSFDIKVQSSVSKLDGLKGNLSPLSLTCTPAKRIHERTLDVSMFKYQIVFQRHAIETRRNTTG